MAFPFLTASWRNLIVLSFRMPPELLRPRLPKVLELDLYDGSCWASLVGFQFLNTRVLGIPWPGFRNFPEWNLRFYVRNGPDHGVCFVREIVPSRLVAFLARTLYNEPYVQAPIVGKCREDEFMKAVHYEVPVGGRTHSMQVVTQSRTQLPDPESLAGFLINQAWGYGTSHRGDTIRYEVTHEPWHIHEVTDWSMDVDWTTLYGPEWSSMNGVKPDSVLLVQGSAVSVYPLGRVKRR